MPFSSHISTEVRSHHWEDFNCAEIALQRGSTQGADLFLPEAGGCDPETMGKNGDWPRKNADFIREVWGQTHLMICISGGFSISMLVYWMLPPLFGTPSHGVSSCVNLEGGLLLSVAIDGGISIYIYSNYPANIESFAEYHRLMYWRLAMAMVCSHPNPRTRPSSDPEWSYLAEGAKKFSCPQNHWAV